MFDLLKLRLIALIVVMPSLSLSLRLVKHKEFSADRLLLKHPSHLKVNRDLPRDRDTRTLPRLIMHDASALEMSSL